MNPKDAALAAAVANVADAAKADAATEAGAAPAVARLPRARSFDDLRQANKRLQEPQPLDVPELGYSIMARELDVGETILISDSTSDEKGNVNTLQNWIKTIVAGVVEPTIGPAEAEEMAKWNFPAFNRIRKFIQGKKNAPSSN